MTQAAVLAGLVALAATVLLTGLVVRFASALGVLDDPATRLHPACLHTRPIPRGGGVALFAAIVGTACLFLPHDRVLVAIVLGASVVALIGYLDDVRANIHPYSRLLGQLVAAGLLLAGGVLFREIPEGLDVLGITPYLSHEGALASLTLGALSVIWTVGLMNAVSWSSGVDGQISGVVVIAAFALACMGQQLGGGQGDSLPFVLATITAGAYAGFFLWHVYPQRIMPGFGGATLAGFLLAAASMLDMRLVPALVTLLAVPLIDAGWIVLKRTFTGHNPVWGDASHLHHQLLAIGWSRQEVAFFYWLATTLFGLLIFSVGIRAHAVACGAILGLACAIITWFNSAAEDARQERGPVGAGDRFAAGLSTRSRRNQARAKTRNDVDNVVTFDARPRLRGQSPGIARHSGAMIRLAAGRRGGWGPHQGS
jgi:UDP-GlcNAc:undecaprenyl-phosphate GlcNAc-1-phosphate transferase